MDPGPYPRPDFTPIGPYAKDKTIGLAVMVLSSLGLCCGVSAAGVGGALGFLGMGFATVPEGDRSVATLLGIGAGFLAIIGFLLIASSAVQIASGIGIMKGRRWGFLLTGVLAAISILLNLSQIPHGLVMIAVNGLIAYYCWARLSGKEGPSPL